MPRIKNPITPSALVALGVKVAKGGSRREIMKEDPAAPDRLIRDLQRAGIGMEEFRARILEELENAAAETLESYRQDLAAGRVPAASKIIGVGVFLDKASQIRGATAVQSVQVDLLVNGYPGNRSRQEIIASLTGEPFSPELGHGGNQSPAHVPVPIPDRTAVINVDAKPIAP